MVLRLQETDSDSGIIRKEFISVLGSSQSQREGWRRSIETKISLRTKKGNEDHSNNREPED